MSLSNVTDFLVYLGVRLFVCTIQAMRLETCRTIAGYLATLACDILKLRRSVVEDNLRIAFPELNDRQRRTLVWSMWEHLFLMVAEIAHAPRKIHRSNWKKYMVTADVKKVITFLLDQRPKVIVAGHFGNFELSGYVLGMFGFPTFTVARPLDNKYLDNFVNDFRSRTGQYMLPKQGSSPEIEKLLAEGGVLGVLGDQAAGVKGCWVEFFGRPASTHKAIALFSLANQAPLALGYAIRTGGPLQYEIGFQDIADPVDDPAGELASVRPLTEWYSQRLEKLVRRAPEQYWWLHRRWKGEPPRRMRKKAA